jgi:hypothetical protein
MSVSGQCCVHWRLNGCLCQCVTGCMYVCEVSSPLMTEELCLVLDEVPRQLVGRHCLN